MSQTATADYQSFYDQFDLATLDTQFHGDFETGINACVECCDRYAGDGRIALNWDGVDGTSRTVSFDELQRLSARFANLLTTLGIGPGDCVAGLLPRTPDLFVVGPRHIAGRRCLSTAFYRFRTKGASAASAWLRRKARCGRHHEPTKAGRSGKLPAGGDVRRRSPWGAGAERCARPTK